MWLCGPICSCGACISCACGLDLLLTLCLKPWTHVVLCSQVKLSCLLSFPTPAACAHFGASPALLLLQKSNRYFRHFAAAAELYQAASHIEEVKEHRQGGVAAAWRCLWGCRSWELGLEPLLKEPLPQIPP